MKVRKDQKISALVLSAGLVVLTGSAICEETPEERYRAIEELLLGAVRDHQVAPGDAADAMGYLRDLFAESEHHFEEYPEDRYDERPDHEDRSEINHQERHEQWEIMEAVESGEISEEDGQLKLESLERHRMHHNIAKEMMQERRLIEEALKEGEILPEEARNRMKELGSGMRESQLNLKKEEAMGLIDAAEESGKISREEAKKKREAVERELRRKPRPERERSEKEAGSSR